MQLIEIEDVEKCGVGIERLVTKWNVRKNAPKNSEMEEKTGGDTLKKAKNPFKNREKKKIYIYN